MKVWDLPTRIYHWLQAALFVGVAVSGLREEGPHVYMGLALFTLLIWRLVWGVVGSDTSRFSQFIRSPMGVVRYLRGTEPERLGHNPAGGYMVIALIGALLLQCITGLALAGMLDTLPGSEIWLSDPIFEAAVLIHENLFKLLFAFVALHLSAILFYKLRGKPLLWAMIVGHQRSANEPSVEPVRFASTRRALGILVIAVSITLTLKFLSD